MYTIFAILLTAGLILLTLWGARCRTAAGMKKILLINLILTGIAILGGSLIPVLTRMAIFGGEGTAEWMNWAWDAFTLFMKTTLPFSGICLLLMLAALLVALFIPKKPSIFSAVIRQSASVACSVILLFLAPFYSAMAETDGAEVHIAILLFGICEALLMRLVSVCETAVRMRGKK